MNIEQLAKFLGDLYSSYGYLPYTMSKFEEYELYLRNKDFLISDRVLTFTDTDGKLMALKPDVTLSIIKNTADSTDSVQKVYYQENVYRPGKNDHGFREIMQIGLECMGIVDDYCILEVLLLAVKSLKAISANCVLDISHMGLVSRLLDDCGLSGIARKKILEAIGNKNAHEIREICESAGVCGDQLATLSQLSGNAKTVLPELESIFTDSQELAQLKTLLTALDKAGVDCINVDFSVVNDMNYYNGIVFRGFVEGIPEGVLSGGQYDALMQKMMRKGKAIGFALYPDLLERMLELKQGSTDAVLLYDDKADLFEIFGMVEAFTQKGIRILALPEQCDAKYKMRYRLVDGEAKLIDE